MSLGARKLHTVAVTVDPVQFLSGWRAERGTLFLAAVSEGRVGEHVAASVGLLGQAIRATVYGSIALVRRVGRPSLPPGVELRLDGRSLPAAHFLALAARGEPISWREREPRWLVDREVRALPEGGTERPVKLVNVSTSGGAVTWNASLPPVGKVVTFRLADGFLAPSVRAVVCWTSPLTSIHRDVGLRLAAEGRGARAWAAMADAARKGGARAV